MNLFEHTSSHSSVLSMCVSKIQPHVYWISVYTNRSISSHLQYPLPGFRSQWLRACHHAFGTVDHTPSTGELDKRWVANGENGFRSERLLGRSHGVDGRVKDEGLDPGNERGEGGSTNCTQAV